MNNNVSEAPIAAGHVMQEKKLTDYLEGAGYRVVDLSYHHNLSDSACGILRCSNTPASIFYRTLPDFFVSKKDNSSFVELKVGQSSKLLYLEAFPFLANRNRQTSLSVPCLYVYAGGITNYNMVAYPVQDIVANTLVIPSRNEGIKQTLIEGFPKCKIEERESRAGTSGDAFVIVDKEQVLQWQPIESFMQ